MNKRSDGRWHERIKLPGMDKPKDFYGKAGDSDAKQKRDIKYQIAEFNADLAKRDYFERVADAWDSQHRQHVTHNAAEFYTVPLNRTKQHFLGRPIQSITPSEIDAYIRSVAAAGLSRRSVQAYRDMLNMIYDYAVVNGLCTVNACASVRMPKGLAVGSREIPTDEQMQKVTAALNKDFGLFAAILMYSGLRRGEALALTWDDIDEESNLIHVTKSVYFDGNNPRFKEPKTAAGRRDVVLLDALRALLPFEEDREGTYIFGGDSPLTKTMEFKHWLNWCREAGLATPTIIEHKGKNGRTYSRTEWDADITPHQLRHYYATMLFDAQIDVKDAQDLLGHASIKVTQDIYTHIRQERRQGTAKKLNEYVNGSRKGQFSGND